MHRQRPFGPQRARRGRTLVMARGAHPATPFLTAFVGGAPRDGRSFPGAGGPRCTHSATSGRTGRKYERQARIRSKPPPCGGRPGGRHRSDCRDRFGLGAANAPSLARYEPVACRPRPRGRGGPRAGVSASLGPRQKRTRAEWGVGRSPASYVDFRATQPRSGEDWMGGSKELS
jgi:hypothetical protein